MAYSIPIINDIFINRLDNIEKQQEILSKKLDIIQSVLLQINRQLLTKNDLLDIHKPYIDLLSKVSSFTNMLLIDNSDTTYTIDYTNNMLSLNNTLLVNDTKKKRKKKIKKILICE